MKWICLLTMFSFSLATNAQILGEDEVYLDGDRVEAKFQGGGIEQFSEFVRSRFDYSKVKKAGKMVAAFTIDTDGKIKDIRLVEFVDSESAIEMIRVLNLSPNWEPAKRGGKPISIDIKYPMEFKSRTK